MSQIRKFSLVYDPKEDRMAWDGEDEAGATVRLWLTQRLCKAMVRALLPMLQAQSLPPGQREAVQSWEQAAAMAGFGKVPGVRPKAEAVTGLVRAVHMRPSAGRIDLTFEFGEDQSRTTEATHQAVRQMLSVLRRLYEVAGWPTDFWPGWISDPSSIPPVAGALN
jgi:hypothetical protein